MAHDDYTSDDTNNIDEQMMKDLEERNQADLQRDFPNDAQDDTQRKVP